MCSYFHSLGIKIILQLYVGLVNDEGQPASFWSVLQEVQEGLQVIGQNTTSYHLSCFYAFPPL
jgi:hypothetical protein